MERQGSPYRIQDPCQTTNSAHHPHSIGHSMNPARGFAASPRAICTETGGRSCGVHASAAGRARIDRRIPHASEPVRCARRTSGRRIEPRDQTDRRARPRPSASFATSNSNVEPCFGSEARRGVRARACVRVRARPHDDRVHSRGQQDACGCSAWAGAYRPCPTRPHRASNPPGPGPATRASRAIRYAAGTRSRDYAITRRVFRTGTAYACACMQGIATTGYALCPKALPSSCAMRVSRRDAVLHTLRKRHVGRAAAAFAWV